MTDDVGVTEAYCFHRRTVDRIFYFWRAATFWRTHYA